MSATAPGVPALAGLVDTFQAFPDQPVSGDPLGWPGYPDTLERARRRTGSEQAVTGGRASVGARGCIVVLFDFGFIGGSMGEAEGRRIVAAIAQATRERLALVSIVRSGGARMQEGMRSLIQMPRVARALAELGAAGVPHVCIARHPTTGGVWASLGAAADLIFAEAGAAVAFAGSRVRGTERDADARFLAEGKLEHGFVDAVLAPDQMRDRLALALELLSPQTRGAPRMPPLPAAISGDPPGEGWSQVLRARDDGRPGAEAYLRRCFSATLDIRGDRVGGVDPGVRCGFGRCHERTIAYVAQLGGVTRAAGYRTAQRLVELASKLGLPVLTLIDSPGADGSAAGEAAGVGTAIARLYQAIAAAEVPVLSVTIGQGGSGGTLSLAAADNLWITADGYFSVIAPESAAAILKRPPEDVPVVADQLRVGPSELLDLGIVLGVLGVAGDRG